MAKFVSSPRLPRRYHLVGPLGAGGMGRVYHVRDSVSAPADKALKLIPPESAYGNIELFRKEFHLVAALRHPNLPVVWDFGELDDGSRYFTADLLRGAPLTEALDRTAPAERAVQALVALCRVLDFLHARGLLHNDVKPGNVIVPVGAGPEGLKLIDFGLAGLDAGGNAAGAGTPGYIAPERLEGRGWDGRADLFAAGATIFRCLAGVAPFAGERASEQLRSVKRGAPPIGVLRADVPPGLERILSWMLAESPAARPARGAAIIEALAREGLGRFPLETPGTALSYALGSVCVGRDRELAAVTEWLGGTAPDVPGLVLGGPAGVGKSRLAEEVRVRCLVEGKQVIRVSAPEPSAFAVARAIVRGLSAAGVTDAGAAERVGPSDPAAAAIALANAIFRGVAAPGLLVVVDGAEGIDGASRDVLERVLDRARAEGRPLWLLLAARDPGDGEALAWINERVAAGTANRLDLAPFGEADVAALVRALFGRDVLPPPDLALLARASAGRPLALEAMIRSLLRDGALTSGASGWTLGHPEGIRRVAAEGLEASVARTLSGLAPGARALLHVIACVGRPEAIDFLAEASATAPGAVALLAADLAAEGLVRVDRTGVDLVHDAIRDLVLAAAPAADLRGCHRAIAEALRARDAPADRLAPHVASAGEPARAVPLAVAAARLRLQGADPRGALSFVDRAIAWAEGLTGLEGELGTAFEIAGDAGILGQRPERVVADYERALAAATRPGDRVRLHAKAARALVRASREEEADAHLDSAQDEVDHAGPLDAATLLAARASRTIDEGPHTETIANARAGLERLAGLPEGDHSTEAAGLRRDLRMTLASALLIDRAYGEAERLHRDILDLHHAEMGPVELMRLETNLAGLLLDTGRPAEALDHVDRALALCREMGSAAPEMNVLWNRSGALDAMGRHAEAEADAVRAAEIASRLGIREQAGLLLLRAVPMLNRGSVEEAMPILERALVAGRQEGFGWRGGEMKVLAAVAALRLGRLARVVEIEREEPREPSPLLRDRQWHDVAGALALAAAGDVPLGVARLEAVAEALERTGAILDAARLWRETAHAAVLGGPSLTTKVEAAAERAARLFDRFGNAVEAQQARDMARGGRSSVSPAPDLLADLEAIAEAGTDLLWARTLERSLRAAGATGVSVLLDEAGGLVSAAGAPPAPEELARWRQRAAEEADPRTGPIESALAAPRRAVVFRAGGGVRAIAVFAVDDAGTHATRLCTVVAAVAIDRITLRSAHEHARDAAVRLLAEREAGRSELTASLTKVSRLLETTVGALELEHVFPEIVGRSRPMRGVLEVLDKVVESDVGVLIVGETGTGKEIVARAIHAHGSRAAGPFVAQNMASFSNTLVESELFGYRRGAFTGAVRDHRGLFEQANGGTLLLDEIGDMDLGLQAKLLRALAEGEVRPLGATRPVQVDVRVLAATHRDLSEMIADGRFREDLLYRLRVLEIRLPPLRERPGDIPELAAHLAARFAGRPVRIARDAMSLLVRHSWPGNVRELENQIERALAISGSTVVKAEHLDPALRAAAKERATAKLPLAARVDALERQVIKEAIRAHRGNKAAVARQLGLTRVGLRMKMRRLGLAPKRERTRTRTRPSAGGKRNSK